MDITTRISRYREATRHLWNTAFHSEEVDWDLRDGFSRVATELFTALVLEPLEAADQRLPEMFEADPQPLRRIAVEPSSDRVGILVNRHTRSSGDWDDPVNVLRRGEAEVRFVAFFDWNQLALRDFQYVLVRILSWPEHAHLVDRFALIEFSSARFLLLPP